MIYLNKITLPDSYSETMAVASLKNIYNSYYPFNLFTDKFKSIKFNDITCFYGTNGSGKSTLLNIIVKRIKAESKLKDLGEVFDTFTDLVEVDFDRPLEVVHITSDDVFNHLDYLRKVNEEVNLAKQNLAKEYASYKYDARKYDLNEYDHLKKAVDARSNTASKYIRTRLTRNNIVMQSNGETALNYFEELIKENGLYLLDEPENSLSPENLMRLRSFIEESVRFFNCQFIIVTHSPFLLSLNGSLIYDLDNGCKSKWTELANVRLYYEFFKEHEKEFL